MSSLRLYYNECEIIVKLLAVQTISENDVFSTVPGLLCRECLLSFFFLFFFFFLWVFFWGVSGGKECNFCCVEGCVWGEKEGQNDFGVGRKKVQSKA